MSQPLPDGYVDPLDAAQVIPVLESALSMVGIDGLVELLARIPGTRRDPGRPGGFLKTPVRPSIWLGAEHNLTLTEPVQHQHVVGGVILSRDPVGRGALAPLVAQLIGPVLRESGGEREASIALTAAREAFGAM
ncbi:MAG: hypothetical protein JWR35_1069 [Marmoricola sp.]|nr:hypothetical protein [Marmoricola sp.]